MSWGIFKPFEEVSIEEEKEKCMYVCVIIFNIFKRQVGQQRRVENIQIHFVWKEEKKNSLPSV